VTNSESRNTYNFTNFSSPTFDYIYNTFKDAESVCKVCYYSYVTKVYRPYVLRLRAVFINSESILLPTFYASDMYCSVGSHHTFAWINYQDSFIIIIVFI
jgi:hypothetical protein